MPNSWRPPGISIDKSRSGPQLEAALKKVKAEMGLSHLSDEDFMAMLSASGAAHDQQHPDQPVGPFKKWFDSLKAGDAIGLQSPPSSRFHQFVELSLLSKSNGDPLDALVLDVQEHHADYQVFLVQHDWAAAFSTATGLEDDGDGFPLPYDRCAFEFQIAGFRFLMLTAPDRSRGGDHVQSAVAMMFDGYWADLFVGEQIGLNKNPLVQCLWQNVRGLCIALDARVAVSTVIRQPYKLNERRRRTGKLPLHDYHVVDLARRAPRPDAPDAAADEARRHPRLHFRRGHWRHFDNHKTWVRWCLVGDPDLGFIDKHYRA